MAGNFGGFGNYHCHLNELFHDYKTMNLSIKIKLIAGRLKTMNLVYKH